MKYITAVFTFLVFVSCNSNNASPGKERISELNLKTGDVISCGPSDKNFGEVSFPNSCNESVKQDFNLAIELLHSFEYDESEKVFAKIIDQQPDCALAYWGVAMSNFHALWTPPTEAELIKGEKAIQIARNLHKSEKENRYIESVAAYFTGWKESDHKTRCLKFEAAMASMYKDYPQDKEVAILYTLSLNAAADPADKTFEKQLKAGKILNALYATDPGHPGIVHYIIHTYDYPGLAQFGLKAARKYAQVAPSSAHALHMPSHVFTRLGLWDESIRSNIASVESAKCYAQSAKLPGHWDEELHGLDYLVYAYLQKGRTDSALKILNYLHTIKDVSPVNFKVAYAYASIPSRYVLETHDWQNASVLKPGIETFNWEAYPWQSAIIHFTRTLGLARSGKPELAKKELSVLRDLQKKLLTAKDIYKANQVEIQALTGEAWINFMSGEKAKGLSLMMNAADLEDKTGKHPVTPGEVLPARELLADMLMEDGQKAEALKQYELVLHKTPNRFNSLNSAKTIAGQSGDKKRYDLYSSMLKSL